jgi:hypothetical protein
MPGALAASWHNQVGKTSGYNSVSILVRWGSGSTSRPTFSISSFAPDEEDPGFYRFKFTLSVTAPNSESVHLFAVLDNDYAVIAGMGYYYEGKPVYLYMAYFSSNEKLHSSSKALSLKVYAITEKGTFAEKVEEFEVSFDTSTRKYKLDRPPDDDTDLPPIGLIAGCVIGGIALIAAIGVGIYCYKKKKSEPIWNDMAPTDSQAANSPSVAPDQSNSPAPEQGYAAPPEQGYAPPQQGYGAPPLQGYGASPQLGYAAPPQQGYAPAPGYGAAPQPGYGGAPPGYAGGYGAPPQQGYGGAPPGYGSPY